MSLGRKTPNLLEVAFHKQGFGSRNFLKELVPMNIWLHLVGNVLICIFSTSTIIWSEELHIASMSAKIHSYI